MMRVFISGFGTVGQGAMETFLLKKPDIHRITGDLVHRQPCLRDLI